MYQVVEPWTRRRSRATGSPARAGSHVKQRSKTANEKWEGADAAIASQTTRERYSVLATQRNVGTNNNDRRSLYRRSGWSGWGGRWRRGATHNYRSRFWRRITACALRARGLPAQLKIDVEPFVLVAALLGREARTVFLAVVQAELRAGRVVGAIAVLPLYDSESECAFLAAVVRAVAVRLVGPCI